MKLTTRLIRKFAFDSRCYYFIKINCNLALSESGGPSYVPSSLSTKVNQGEEFPSLAKKKKN
jgi:hypothetical protein